MGNENMMGVITYTMGIIVTIVIMFSMISIIVVSYCNQQEKHKRHREWMKQNRRND